MGFGTEGVGGCNSREFCRISFDTEVNPVAMPRLKPFSCFEVMLFIVQCLQWRGREISVRHKV
jgi:hypothetical protein